jgi:hypothetical protein
MLFMMRSMDKAQTESASATPVAPQEERAADLRMLAALFEIRMTIARAT